MGSVTGNSAFGGELSTQLIHNPGPAKVRTLRLPGIGRVAFSRDPGTGNMLSTHHMGTHLFAVHRDGDGKMVETYDLGSGNVQTNFVVGLMWDAQGTTNNKGAPVLTAPAAATAVSGVTTGRYMYSGTGTTVNDYDYQLATTAGPASGAITPTYGFGAASSAPASQLQYVGTIAYVSSLAITEWGLFNTNSQGAMTSSTVNTATATGTSASTWTTAPSAINSLAGMAAVATSTSPVVGGYIWSNSTATTASLITIGTGTVGWYNLNSNATLATGTTPASNSTIGVYPLMFDHKTFAAINVVNGDSIQFTYTLSIVAGG